MGNNQSKEQVVESSSSDHNKDRSSRRRFVAGQSTAYEMGNNQSKEHVVESSSSDHVVQIPVKDASAETMQGQTPQKKLAAVRDAVEAAKNGRIRDSITALGKVGVVVKLEGWENKIIDALQKGESCQLSPEEAVEFFLANPHVKNKLTVTCNADNCDKRSVTSYDCKGCGEFKFCSLSCKQRHWSETHHKECKGENLNDTCSATGCEKKHWGETSLDALKHCTRCYSAWYCSRQCQKNHFKSHKKWCVEIKRADAPAMKTVGKPPPPNVPAPDVPAPHVLAADVPAPDTISPHAPAVEESDAVIPVCNRAGCPGNGDYKCTQCGARYCSKQCQLLAWDDHKMTCRKSNLCEYMVCQNLAVGLGKGKVCFGCRAVKYCSGRCRRKDQQKHSMVCNMPRDARRCFSCRTILEKCIGEGNQVEFCCYCQLRWYCSKVCKDTHWEKCHQFKCKGHNNLQKAEFTEDCSAYFNEISPLM